MDIPLNQQHFAAIIHDSIHHEGDERSRMNPGHGYAAYDENILRYKPFKDQAEMQKWVEEQEKSSSYSRKKKYQIILAAPLAVSVEVKVTTVPVRRTVGTLTER